VQSVHFENCWVSGAGEFWDLGGSPKFDVQLSVLTPGCVWKEPHKKMGENSDDFRGTFSEKPIWVPLMKATKILQTLQKRSKKLKITDIWHWFSHDSIVVTPKKNRKVIYSNMIFGLDFTSLYFLGGTAISLNHDPLKNSNAQILETIALAIRPGGSWGRIPLS